MLVVFDSALGVRGGSKLGGGGGGGCRLSLGKSSVLSIEGAGERWGQ